VPWWREQAYYDEPGRGTYARDGGGVLISQAIHTIDLALTLTGPVASVHRDDGHHCRCTDGGGGCGRFRACASPMARWAG
jgi:predicted dehydrogenase